MNVKKYRNGKDLIKQAIADANAVQKFAIDAAKYQLQESFRPRVQSMISRRLAEEEMEDEPVEENEEMPDEEMPVDEGDEMAEDEPVEESEDNGEEIAMEESDDEEYSMEEAEDTGEEIPMEESDDEDEHPDDVMEIIRQLEEEANSSDIGSGDNKKPSPASSKAHTTDKKEKLVQLVKEEEGEDEITVEEAEDEEVAPVEESEDDDIDLEEILNSLREEDESDEEPVAENEDGGGEETAELEERLREAYQVIGFIRNKLNEVNLVNSKLMFSTKLFNSYSLNERQKMAIIENFDRATTLREVKIVYTTLAESLRTAKRTVAKIPAKSKLKEAYASKPINTTRPTQVITESNQLVNRLQKLAGII